MTPDALEREFRRLAPAVDYCSLRFVSEQHETIRVRQDVLQPLSLSEDQGLMVTVADGGGEGYAATSDLSPGGIKRAFDEASSWASVARDNAVKRTLRHEASGAYRSPVAKPWTSLSLADRIALVQAECARLKVDDRIVDWEAMLWNTAVESLFLSSDGARIEQQFDFLVPYLHACASDDHETQTRSLGGHGCCRQGGLEVLDEVGFLTDAPTIGAEAVELLHAPDCPSGDMTLVLAPDQMILQIHESSTNQELTTTVRPIANLG